MLEPLGEVPSRRRELVASVALAAQIDEAAPRPDREHGGRAPCPSAPMARGPVLEPRAPLGDAPRECQRRDQLSVPRFVSLRQSSPAPDRGSGETLEERRSTAGGREKSCAAGHRHAADNARACEATLPACQKMRNAQ